MTTRPDPQITAAAVMSIAEAILAGMIAPSAIDLWSQSLSARQLLEAADTAEAKIIIHWLDDDKTRGHASVRYRPPVAPGGAPITVYSISNDLSPAALAQYAQHNETCLKLPAAP